MATQPIETIITPGPIARSSGISGTDIAAILGLHPNRGPWDVYAAKAGLVPPLVPDARVRAGKALEKGIAELYAAETGHIVVWRDTLYRHPQRAWQIGTPDFECADADIGGDAKNVAWDQMHRWGQRGSDAVPDEYALQAHWYMSLRGRRQWDVAALFGGNDLGVYTIAYDPDIEATLLDAGDRFWREYVLTGKAPDLSHSEAAGEYVKRRFPRNVVALRKATPEEVALIGRFRNVRDSYKAQEKEFEALANQVRAVIADAEGIEGEFGKITYKCNKDSTKVDWEAVAMKLIEFELGRARVIVATHTAPSGEINWKAVFEEMSRGHEHDAAEERRIFTNEETGEVDWGLLAREYTELGPKTVTRHTAKVPGARVLRPSFR